MYSREPYVTPEELIEFYSYISIGIEQDALFELTLSSVWTSLNDCSVEGMPFAGTRTRVKAVNAREAYRHDHHRNLFGTDEVTPFSKKQTTEW